MNVVVLYEDSRGPDRAFRFHDLVVRTVADQLGVADDAFWTLNKRLTPMPLNGNGNVLEEIRDPVRLGRLLHGNCVVAAFDRDRVVELLPPDVAGCTSSVVAELLRGVTNSADVKIALVDRNLESIIEAIRAADPHIVADDECQRALNKNLVARDTIFAKAATRRNVRDAVAAIPSFAYLIDCITKRLR